MSLISFKSIITLCSISVLAAACAPRAYYGQPAPKNNLPLYTSAAAQQQTVPLSGQPQTIQSSALPQVSYNNAGVMAPVIEQPKTFSMLSTPAPSQPQYNVTSTTAPQVTSVVTQTFDYKIQKGDTLFAVGRKFNIHPQDIADHNSMMNPHDLRVGQSIRIPSNGRQYPADNSQQHSNNVITAPQTPSVTSATKNSSLLEAVRSSRTNISSGSVKYFKMPQQGRIVQNYDGKSATGVRIVVPNHTSLRAATSGEVIYVGSVDGYGKMVLIRHNDGYVSNYAGLNKIYVKQGQSLKTGDIIATASSSNASMAEVLFELRQGTKTVNPHAFIG